MQNTFKNIEGITSVADMTNEQLKQILQKIEVDKDGNVDIYLRVFGDLGLDDSVLICNDNTEGHFGDIKENEIGRNINKYHRFQL